MTRFHLESVALQGQAGFSVLRVPQSFKSDVISENATNFQISNHGGMCAALSGCAAIPRLSASCFKGQHAKSQLFSGVPLTLI